MPVTVPTRFTILAVVAVLSAGLLLFLAWSSSPWIKSVFSQEDTGDCRVVFTQLHDNIDVNQTVEYIWTYENADSVHLRITAPDAAVATLASHTQTTASIVGVAQGVSELTVAVHCTNEKQEGQWIASSAPVVVGGADGSHLDSWPPEEGPVGEESAPDLQVMNATVIPNTATSGESVRVGAEVHNEGTASSGATKLKFYRSTNAIISTLDTQIGVNDIPALNAGRHWASVHYFNAPDAAGTYYYGACVDKVPNESPTYNNCSSAATLTVTQFSFTPDPMGLGGKSNVWTVPAGITRLYLDVDFSIGDNKDPSGDILIQRVDTSNNVLETYAVDNENDSGSLSTNFKGGSRVRIEIEDDAFDTHAALVTLTFHSGTSISGAELAVGKVQKEQRPFAPRNGSSSVNHTGTGTVTLTWSKGLDRDHDNPDHYRLEIPDTHNPGTFLYTDYNISDSNDPTTYTITNARSHDLEGTHLVYITHCNQAGGCSFAHGISFTLNPVPPPDTPIPPTPIPTATPLPTILPPPNIRLILDTSFLLTIGWDEQDDATDYQVRDREAGDSWGKPKELSGDARTHSKSDLKRGKTYEFQVSSKGDGVNHLSGWGDWSATHSYTTPQIQLSGLAGSLKVGEVDQFHVEANDLNEERDYALSVHADDESGLGTRGETEERSAAASVQADCSVETLRRDLSSNKEGFTWDLEVKGCASGDARITGVLWDRTDISDPDDYREVTRDTGDVRVRPQSTPTPLPTPTPTVEPPPKPTGLSLSVDPDTSGRLVFRYQPSLWARSANHHYILELHKVGSSTVVQSKRATVSGTDVKSGHFTGIAPGEKYRARAQRCPDTNFNHCGNWSDWVVIPPPPTSLVLSRHATDPAQMSFSYTTTSWEGVAGKTKGHQLELAQENSDGSWASQGIVSSSSSPHSLTGLTGGGTYRVRGRQCGDGTNDLCGYWSAWSNSESVLKLKTPVITDVEPNALRQATFTWTPVSGAVGYNILVHKGTSQSYINDGAGNPMLFKNTEYLVSLDEYFRDNDDDKFQVKAVASAGTNVLDSDLSAAVMIARNPIKRVDGNSVGSNRGKAKVDWQGTANGSKFVVRYRWLGEDNDEQDWSGYDDYGPWKESDELPAGTVSHLISDLRLKTVYAVQLQWEEAGIQVYSGTYSYVWPNNGLPARGFNDQGRVASYPYYGHWPNRTYSYNICADTFDDNRWTQVINRAFRTWQDATDGLVTMANTGNTCNVGDHRRYPTFLLMTNMVETSLNVNEVYMVRDKEWSSLQKLNLGIFIDDVQGYCGVITPSACVISKAYALDQSASTRLSNARGSDNAVDILFKQSGFQVKRVGSNDVSPLGVPSSVTYYQCDGVPQHSTTFAYEVALHEAGHALGTSGLFFVPASTLLSEAAQAILSGPTAVFELLAAILATDPPYHGAHPAIPGSVMNYNYKVAGASGEPDCFPHPFDVMAIFALYQTVNR